MRSPLSVGPTLRAGFGRGRGPEATNTFSRRLW